MMNTETDITWMTAALEEARLAADLGEVPVGAVAVAGGEIIARAHNRIELDRDAAAHAEMLLLHEVCRILDRWRLSDVTVYVTVEPCPMCAMALVLHRVARVVFGAPEPRTGAAGSFINLLTNPALNHAVAVTAGVCRDDASELMKAFFRNRRESSMEIWIDDTQTTP
ncbi:MAG TPA: tRNA adenosine(34) deaminase TadA [bacterium]|nr:tRNA adenosine(34) deaminase TadA [bacterium]